MAIDVDFLYKQEEHNIDDYETDYEKGEYIQLILTNQATNDGSSNNDHYKILRRYFLENPATKPLVPKWVRTKRDLSHFWQFIKVKFPSYAERRTFIWDEFSPLMEYLEKGDNSPHSKTIEENLDIISFDYVALIWRKALQRSKSDPEGAITSSRSLVEAVLKHLLDKFNEEYSDNCDLSELYKLLASKMNLTPEQHSETIFKQILGNCSGVVSGLGSLRNKLGDAHGKGNKLYKPNSRHAELAINLAGSMCLFLVQTFLDNYNRV